MVTSLGKKRNTIYSSLSELDKKLEELGLVEINGQIVLLHGKEAHNASLTKAKATDRLANFRALQRRDVLSDTDKRLERMSARINY